MTSDHKRSGLRLCIAGLAGVSFFWITDPRWGLAARAIPADELIDAVNQAFWGTIVGLVGSSIVLLIGLWLMTRRTM